MTTYRKSVPKPVKGSGTAKIKKGLVTLIFADDILSWPEDDVNGIGLLGNIILKSGATMHQLYLTPTTQKISDEISGDEDFEVFDKKFEAVHSGNSMDIREFRNEVLGEDIILICGENCGINTGDVLGTPCNPFRLKGSYANDNEGVKNIMMFEPLVLDREPIKSYAGEITLASNFVAADVDLELTKANGSVQQLPSLEVTDAITAASIDLDGGTTVSLIGGGGTNPATLDTGTQGQVDVILLNGTQWVGLKDAIINLEVVEGGATTYLIERSRA
jgi:hypothetical protein